MLSFTAMTTLNGPMAQFEGLTPKIEATNQARRLLAAFRVYCRDER